MKDIKDYIRTIPNFPKEGILFRDITTVIQNPEGFKLAIDMMQESLADVDFDMLLGAESRGFLFAAPIAYNLGKAMTLARKKGKLPAETVSVDYDLEYGVATLEIHKDAIKPGQKVVLVDDLLATGGTLKAMAKLVEKLGGEVAGIAVLLELVDLKGREVLKDYNVYSCAQYEGE